MRGIKKAAKAIVGITLLASLIVGAIGCGDSTSNDQGVSFTFLGWFIEIDDEIVGVTTTAMPISGYTESSDPEFGFPGFTAAPALLAGMSNNLTGQFIRVDRIHHEYYVPGASSQPPSTSVAVPTTLLPAPDGAPPASSLPASLDPDFVEPPAGAEDVFANIVFAGTDLVPSNVREFIVINKNQFPEPPFILVVTSYASGVTSAGNRYDSNRIEFEILVEPDVVITPTPGTGGAGVSTAEAEVFE